MKTPVQDRSSETAAAPLPSPPGDPSPESRRRTPRETSEAGKRARSSFSVMDVVWFVPRLMLRLFFPKLLDRYVVGELLAPMAFGWTMFIVLFVFSLNLFKLAQLASRGAPLPMVGEMLLLRVVLASVYCLPMAMLLAGLLAFGRLSGDSELIATQAGGIPNLRVIRNAFILGMVLSIVGLAMNEYIIPDAGKRLHYVEESVKTIIKGRVLDELSEQKAFVFQDFDGGKLARVIIARKFEEAETGRPAQLKEVTYMSYARRKVEMIVQAERAEWVGADPNGRGKQIWRFINATTQLMANVTGGKRMVIHSDVQEYTLNKTPEQVARAQKDADQMSYRELTEEVERLKEQGVKNRIIREFEVEKERKLAVPFAAMVFALIGAPLGIRRQRSTAGVGVGLSLLIIILYYVGMSFLGVLGQNGSVSAVAAAWGCNISGLIAGVYLTWRSSR